MYPQLVRPSLVPGHPRPLARKRATRTHSPRTRRFDRPGGSERSVSRDTSGPDGPRGVRARRTIATESLAHSGTAKWRCGRAIKKWPRHTRAVPYVTHPVAGAAVGGRQSATGAEGMQEGAAEHAGPPPPRAEGGPRRWERVDKRGPAEHTGPPQRRLKTVGGGCERGRRWKTPVPQSRPRTGKAGR